ncbi:low molecular weight protein-tyrosine-phosphatase [Pseudomonas spelaei]
MFNKILIVCVGNICRSPTAEKLLHSALASSCIEVRSAGLAALQDHPLEPMASRLLEERGYTLLAHSARQLTRAAVSDADLVLVMEQRHIDGVLEVAPEARGKVFLLGKWQHDREIKDPYRQGRSAFIHAFALIEQATQAWASRLLS